MSNSFYQRQVGALPVGTPGHLASSHPGNTIEEALEVAGIQAQVTTVTIDTADNSTLYSVVDNFTGEAIEYESDATATEAEVAAGLAANANANPVLAGRGIFTSAGADFIATGRSTGDAEQSFDLALSANAASMSIANVPASIDAGIPFGVPVYMDADGRATTTKPAGNIEDVLRGISLYDYTHEMGHPGPNSAVVCEAGRFLRVLRGGSSIYVADGENAKRGELVYIGTGAGEVNKFYNATGAGRLAVPRLMAEWDGPHAVKMKLGA